MTPSTRPAFAPSKITREARGRAWPRKTAVALACLALSAPSSAEITGYSPDSQNFPFTCSAPSATCEPGLSKLDLIRHVRLVSCRTWATSGPARCANWDLDQGSGGAKDAYGLDAQALMNRAFAAWQAFQASQDLSVYSGGFIATRLGTCVDTTNVSGLAKICRLYGRKVIGTGAAQDPYRLQENEVLTDTNRITVDQVNPGALCANYVPGLGCPTAAASRDTTPTALSCDASSPTVGDPISIITGAVTESRQDLSWPIDFSRHYASNRTVAGEMGNWRHGHESSLAVTTASGASGRFDAGLVFTMEDGSEIVLTRASASAAFAPAFKDQKTTSAAAVAQGYELTLPSRERRVYAGSGKMLSRSFPSGYFLNYAYDAAGRLASIGDAYARGLVFAYEGASRQIRRVSTVGGASSDMVEYLYEGSKLLSARFNGGAAVGYEHEPSGKLLRIVDELGAVAAQFEYDPATGKALSSRRFARPGQETEATVLSHGSTAVTVTQGGADSVYSITRDGTNLKSRVSSATLGGSASNYTVGYDSSGGHPISFKAGTMTDAYTVDSSTLLPSKLVRATGGTENYTWDAALRKLQTVTDTSPQGTRTTQYIHDAQGNALSVTVSPGSGASRSWSWTYGTMGKPLTAAGPDGAQTVYEYYPDDDLISPARRGQIKSVTNPLGQKTDVAEHDERGRATRIVDPNGVATELGYDDRGRLLSWSRSGVSRTMSYDAAGQLKTLALSNGYSATFDYDDAQRLVRVADVRGAQLALDYDERGNAVKRSLSQGSVLILELNRTFDALGQVQSEWAADPAKARSRAFDANGRLKTAKDGLGRSSAYNYATSGGMSSYAEPGSSATIGRDVDDNPTSHASSGTSTTSYVWNDFGEILSVSSSDSGPQTYVHNAQARTRSMTDAAGIVHATSFDAFGRVASATHAGAGLAQVSETYAYDNGRVGLPDSVADASGTTSWTWSAFDEPATKTRVVDGVSLTMSYGHDARLGRGRVGDDLVDVERVRRARDQDARRRRGVVDDVVWPRRARAAVDPNLPLGDGGRIRQGGGPNRSGESEWLDVHFGHPIPAIFERAGVVDVGRRRLAGQKLRRRGHAFGDRGRGADADGGLRRGRAGVEPGGPGFFDDAKLLGRRPARRRERGRPNPNVHVQRQPQSADQKDVRRPRGVDTDRQLHELAFDDLGPDASRAERGVRV
jgi:YD repeat-containing protein